MKECPQIETARYLIGFKTCLDQIANPSRSTGSNKAPHGLPLSPSLLRRTLPISAQNVRRHGCTLDQAQWATSSSLLCQDLLSSVTSKSAAIYLLFCFFDVTLYAQLSHLIWHREGAQQMIVFVINLKSYYPTLLRILEDSCHIAATQ